MRAQLAAFARVQPTLKQRAKNRHVNGRPVQRGGVAQLGHVQHIEGRYFDAFEQPAVKPRNVVVAIHAAISHDVEKAGHAAGEFVTGQAAVVHQAIKHAAGQQADVFSKKAEQALREEVRHVICIGFKACGIICLNRATLEQVISQCGKTFGGVLRDVAAGDFGPEAFRVKPDTEQLCQPFQVESARSAARQTFLSGGL